MRNQFRFWNFVYLLFIISFILCIAGCERRFKETKFLMSTIVEITAVGSEQNCQQAMEQAFEEIERIDRLMNVYNADSEISRINNSAGKSSVQVSSDTLEVINQSLRISSLTGGAFDITILPLMELWEFGEKMEENDLKRVPSDNEIQEKLKLVDYRKVAIDAAHSAVMLSSPGRRLDVGGIAKGYAVDKVVQTLKTAGIRSALVNAGGDIYAMGSPPDKDSWKVGIQHPRRRAELLGTLELKDKAVATSGDYENFFEVNGKRYCHIMNPRTGRPVEGIMSVTIVAETTTEADALATSVFPLGADDGMKLIEKMDGVDGIIITGNNESDMKILISSGLKDKVQLRPDLQ